MIYLITGYQSEPEYWILKPKDGGVGVMVDLVVGNELESEMKQYLNGSENIHDYFKWARSLVGREIEVKHLLPITAIGGGIKLR